jgi:predicted RNA-binding Zn-ribbon protein involved in translation (DUF1610 family)
MIWNLVLNFWWVVVLTLLVYIFRQPSVKGKVGEVVIALFMKFLLDKTRYHIVNNITIPDDKGGTTQIDHVVVSKYGIFVVETKNMKGWIFGDAKAEKWTQQLFKVKHTFQNPLRQNHKHIKSLAAMLNLTDNLFIHVIAFVGDCKLKTCDKLPPNVTGSAFSTVAFIKSCKDEKLSENEIEAILTAIETGRLAKTLKTHREHVKHVKGIIADKERNFAPAPEQQAEPDIAEETWMPKITSDEPLCPQCGAKMIKRTASRGANSGNTFWGCSRYPKCKAIL